MQHSQLRTARGFTLIETVMAVALSALLIGLVGSGIRIYTRLVADRRADVVNSQVARAVLQQIAEDIRSTYYAAAEAETEEAGTDATDPSLTGSDPGTGTTGVDSGSGAGTGTEGTMGGTANTGTGGSSSTDAANSTADLTTTAAQPIPGLYGNDVEMQLDIFGRYIQPLRYDSLTSAGVDAQSSNLWSDPKVVTYYLRQSQPGELDGTPLEPVDDDQVTNKLVLVRRVQSRAAATFAASSGGGDGGGAEQLLSDQFISLKFSYYDGYEWVDSWDAATSRGLPMAVKIEATVADQSTEQAAQETLTTDNAFQVTVRTPTAVLPSTDTSTTGL